MHLLDTHAPSAPSFARHFLLLTIQSQTMETFTQLVRDVSITGLPGVQLPALAVMKSLCFCIAAVLSAPAPYVSIPSRIIRHVTLCAAICFSHIDRDYGFPVRFLGFYTVSNHP
jgi:hypothetical protein